MSTIDNYHKDVDHEKIADCGKDDATKGGNWESTVEIHMIKRTTFCSENLRQLSQR